MPWDEDRIPLSAMTRQFFHDSSKMPVAGAIVGGISRSAVYIWAGPNTLIGLVAMAVALLSGGSARRVEGVIEVEGGIIRFLLARCTLIRGGATAMTLGHVVIARDCDCLRSSRAHERVHVRQYERWGPLFLPAYLLSSVFAWMRGQRPYLDNYFERQAYQIAGSS